MTFGCCIGSNAEFRVILETFLSLLGVQSHTFKNFVASAMPKKRSQLLKDEYLQPIGDIDLRPLNDRDLGLFPLGDGNLQPIGDLDLLPLQDADLGLLPLGDGYLQPIGDVDLSPLKGGDLGSVPLDKPKSKQTGQGG